ncbi:hypothetical protein OG474_36495 [Kribbella sp. NBC_01505]|uniref:hypothetical protein n=1 Tax=Kribbella sp. NBC_01505 TaxID=2903580 RepID=UPI00386578E6
MVRRVLALLATLLVVAVAVLTTTPAAAGGPTSVLLSAPPHVVAFGYDDPQYRQLQTLTQVATPREPRDLSHESGPFVRATWLIHDMDVWRIDIIYPEAPGGPWIATSESLDGTVPLGKPVWHTGTDSVALTKLLSSLKLLTGLRNGEQFVGGPTTLDRSAPEPVQEAQPQPQAIATSTFTGWRWLLPGALLGALLTWAATRFLRQRRWDLIEPD